jgi:PAS domain S-box-containing protein
MKLSLRRDLGLQLLSLYLLFVAPVVLASLIFDYLASQRIESDVKAADLALARAIAQETNTALGHALDAVANLASYPEVLSMDIPAMERLFGNLMSARPDVNLVYRLDAQGMMVFHYPLGPGSTVGTDFSFRDYYQRALTTHAPFLSQGRISPTTNQPVTTAIMPLWDTNNVFLGLVATNIKLQSLSTTLASIATEHRPEEGFSVAIIDESGKVIAHPDPEFPLTQSDLDLPAVTQPVLSGESGNIISPDPQGAETLYSYVPIPSAGWGVIVSRPTATAFATSRAAHQGVLLTIGVFLIVGLFFWLALSRQVLRPVERLAAFSQTIGLDEEATEGQRMQLSALSERPDQIGHLIRSLARMEEAIGARLRELSTLLETSAAVVSTLDSKMVLDRILEQVERLMGIQMCTILALDEKRGVFRARASRGLSKRYTEQLAISPSEPLSVSLRAIRSGEPIQISDTETDTTFTALRPRARSEGYRSVLAVPLNTQHAPPSALLVYRPDPHTFTRREINLLTSFANHAAMAIENAALYARSDMRLNEQTRRLEALIQSFQDGLTLEDLKGMVLYANRRMSELVGVPLPEIIGAPGKTLIERLLHQAIDKSEEQQEKTRQALEEALNGRGVRRVELATTANHHTRYLALRVFDVTDADGTPIGRGQILRDITRDREIDRMKSSLISTVSHELRTPLAAIKGYATTLLAEDVAWDKVTQHEFLEIISSETDRLSKLVNDLLDMSRIESGNLDVNRAECNLYELVQRAAQRAHPPPLERLTLDIPPDLPTLFVDPQRIEAVLRNLIENAAKYGGDSTPILVSAAIETEHVVIRVKDEGPGVPVEYRERIFESFYRLENGLARPVAGAGLGLAICQGFISAHGGKIWLEPVPKGTCVAFSLPLTIVPSDTSHNMVHIQDWPL